MLSQSANIHFKFNINTTVVKYVIVDHHHFDFCIHSFSQTEHAVDYFYVTYVLQLSIYPQGVY